MTTSDKRSSERRDCYIEAHYESPNLSLNVVVRNISNGGCFIVSPFLDTPGTTGMVFLNLPQKRTPVAIPAKVVYTRDDTIISSGMGIKFLLNTSDDLLKINNVLQAIKKQ